MLKKKKKKFTITIEDFKDFCIQTNYLELKSRCAGGASIDRIDPDKGYEKGNLQILSVSENSIKNWTDRNDCSF